MEEARVTMSTYRALRYLEKHTPVPLVGICVYEAVALTYPGHRIPTISKLCHHHKWVFPVFCAALGAHIWFYDG